MKTSVIIPTKNGGFLFKDVLKAVLTQKTPWPYEILVIDSGSTDGTVEYCEQFSDVQVHRIPPQEFGHGKTRNLGVSMTEGEFVVFITQDAMPADDHWLNEIVQANNQSDNVAGAFGRQKAYPGSSPFITRDLDIHFEGFSQTSGPVCLTDTQRYERDQGYRQFLHFFSNSNSCLRRKVWEKFPFPDVNFAEDQMWANRIIKAGYAKAYAHKGAVYHSHDFGFWEQGRRSFDESYALYQIFGYTLCPSVIRMLGESLRTTVNDIKYAVGKGRGAKQLRWVVRSPLRNTFRQIGFYFGQRADRLPLWMVQYISRDQSLRRIGTQS
ncbi:MAG: glycosyltransferase family 2 protein [Pseudomonadota bacterium]